jgi:hypothetical protein
MTGRAWCAAVAGVAAVVHLGVAGAAAAQTPDNRAVPVFLERSYFFNRLPVDTLTFEVHLAPHLFWYQREYQRGELYDRPVHGMAFTLTPMVRLRMFSTSSFPVRTPSYMPRPLVAQFFRAALVDGALGIDSPVGLWGATLIPWAHHSNGQDGCLYADQVGHGDGCVDTAPPGAARAVNRQDGSFSTNYARLTGHYRHIRTDSPDRWVEMTGQCTFEAGVEVHPDDFLMGDIAPEQASLYPQFRVHGGTEVAAVTGRGRWWQGRSSLQLRAEYLRGTAPGVPAVRWQAEASHTRHATGWGLFARYFDGMDYYNLGFLDHRRWLQLGISFDLFRGDEFALPADGPARPNPDYPRGALDELARPLNWLCERVF